MQDIYLGMIRDEQSKLVELKSLWKFHGAETAMLGRKVMRNISALT